jgi:hypothetical protein
MHNALQSVSTTLLIFLVILTIIVMFEALLKRTLSENSLSKRNTHFFQKKS